MNEVAETKLRQIYSDIDREIDVHNPRCDLSGRCCRFTEYGHTLFLSGLEAELLLEPGLPEGTKLDPNTCPYQIGKMCTARERRPLGCRVFFCDPTYAEKQPEICERGIARLKQLHDELEMPWNYAPLHYFLENELDPKINGKTDLDATYEIESA